MEKARHDSKVLGEIIKRHERNYNKGIEVLAADHGFMPGEEKLKEYESKVERFAISMGMATYRDNFLVMWQIHTQG